MYQLLDNDLWVISKSCPKLIETIPTLIVEEGLEDVLKVDATEGQIGDDAYDSARYGLKSYLAPRGKPFEVRVKERVDSIAQEQGHASFEAMEPTSRAMLARRVLRAEPRGGVRIYRPFGRRRIN